MSAASVQQETPQSESSDEDEVALGASVPWSLSALRYRFTTY